MMNSKKGSSKFRADIQGLRALAVTLVFIYHLWPNFLTGGYVGVDVFFVVSGFLITNILKREVLATGQLNLAGFYIRRARRLLPAASLVIICSGLLTLAFFPAVRWDKLASEMSASALYFQNFFLYFQSVDYLTQDSPPSLLRHYWSLSVEEQFYFIWPLLMIVAAKWMSKSQWSGTAILFLLCSSVFIISLYSSIATTAANPSGGYFLPQNRLFELSLGGMLSIVYPLLRLGKGSSWLLGWLGVSGVVVSAVYFNHETVFPGFTALLPTLGTALVIVAGAQRSQRTAASGLLGLRPLRYIGDISYSLYLWHWPIILSCQQFFGENLSIFEGLLVIVVSLLCAHFTKFHIEDRWRYPKEGATTWLALARFSIRSLAFVLCLSLVIELSTSQAFEPLENLVYDTKHPGALSLTQKGSVKTEEKGEFVPTIEAALRDNPALYADGCHTSQLSEEPTPCWYGPVEAKQVIVLAGDSHAAHWLPALRALSERNDFAVVTYTKSSCPFIQMSVIRGKAPYKTCESWNVNALKEILELKPDLVVTSKISSTRAAGIQNPGENNAAVVDAMALTWKELGGAGIPVLAIEQTPRFDFQIPECMATSENGLQECARTRTDVLSRYDPTPEAAEKVATAVSIDMNDWICLETTCPPVIGNVLVYRDQHHLTATYSRSLSAELEEHVLQTLKHYGIAVRQNSNAVNEYYQRRHNQN